MSAEIQRLADQSADATLQIEDIVRDIRKGVADGVREARTAHDQVTGGVEQAERIGQELGGIMTDVGELTSRFGEIRDLVAEQTAGTEAIRGSIEQVNEGAEAISNSSTEFSDVSRELQGIVDRLRDLVAGWEGDAMTGDHAADDSQADPA